jgi:serine/threonine protein kinase
MTHLFETDTSQRNTKKLNFLENEASGNVFRVKNRELDKYTAIKKMEFKFEHKNDTIKEFKNCSIIHKMRFQKNDFLVNHIDARFEEENIHFNSNDTKFSLYIEMELCDRTLKVILDEIDCDINLKKEEF